MFEEMTDDSRWWSVFCGGILWCVKRKKQSWGSVEGLLENKSQTYANEQCLNAIYFVKQNVEPVTAFERTIYKLCLGEDISAETNYSLNIDEVLSVDQIKQRFQ